jgi:hypothetical protein
LRIFRSESAIGKRSGIPASPHELLRGRTNEWRSSNLHGAQRLASDHMLDGRGAIC